MSWFLCQTPRPSRRKPTGWAYRGVVFQQPTLPPQLPHRGRMGHNCLMGPRVGAVLCKSTSLNHPTSESKYGVFPEPKTHGEVDFRIKRGSKLGLATVSGQDHARGTRFYPSLWVPVWGSNFLSTFVGAKKMNRLSIFDNQ